MDIGGLVVAQDLATVALGLMNAGYFAAYGWRHRWSHGRRSAALAMTAVSIAAVVEAVFSQELRLSESIPDGLWALARAPLLIATAFISLIIARRMVS